MKRIFYSVLLICISLSICKTNSSRNVAFYNFNGISVDRNNQLSLDISNSIQADFIDLIKNDLSFISDLHFIPTRELENRLSNTRKILLENIEDDLRENIINIVPIEKLQAIIRDASRNRLNPSQVKSIADSLVISISEMTRDITKDMMMSNTVEPDQPFEITLRDLYQFINRSTKKSINTGTFSHFITSSFDKFNVDIIIVGKSKIVQDHMTVDFFIYDYNTLNLINKVSANSSIDKLHVLIKDIEFKLLDKLGVDINDDIKIKLCKYDVSQFSKDKYSLYFSNLFIAEDLKELKIRFQIDDNYNMINHYYQSIFDGLSGSNINYSIKFYNDDNFYQIYSTESSNDSSVAVNVLNDRWLHRVGSSSTLEGGNNLKKLKRNSKIEANISYDAIQGVQFKKDNRFNIIRRISTYALILASGFFIILLL